MMQEYPFLTGLDAAGTFTSPESVSTPSQQVLDFIRAFARSIQTLAVGSQEITICLN